MKTETPSTSVEGKLVTMAAPWLTHNPLQCLAVTMFWHATELILNQRCLGGTYEKAVPLADKGS